MHVPSRVSYHEARPRAVAVQHGRLSACNVVHAQQLQRGCVRQLGLRGDTRKILVQCEVHTVSVMAVSVSECAATEIWPLLEAGALVLQDARASCVHLGGNSASCVHLGGYSTLRVFIWEGKALRVFIWEGTALHASTWEGTARHAFIWEGTARHAFIWEGTARHGFTWERTALRVFIWMGAARATLSGPPRPCCSMPCVAAAVLWWFSRPTPPVQLLVGAPLGNYSVVPLQGFMLYAHMQAHMHARTDW